MSMPDYTPPVDWQEKMEERWRNEKTVTRGVKEVFKETTKAPRKVEFRPTPVKPVNLPPEQPSSVDIVQRESGPIEAHHVLKDYFDIEDEPGYTENEKLRAIWGYLGEKYPSKQLLERKHQLRQIELKLGEVKLGQSRLGRIHDYIMAQKMVEDAERWRDGVIGKKVR